MRQFAALIGAALLCAACSSSTPPADQEAAPSSREPQISRKQARLLIEAELNASDKTTRTPSLRTDLPCIGMINVVTIDDSGQAELTPDAIGHFTRVVNEQDGFYLEYKTPLEWKVAISSIDEVSPGTVDISYTANVIDPPRYIVLWFEACSTESGTEKIQLTDQGTRRAENSGGEWKLI